MGKNGTGRGDDLFQTFVQNAEVGLYVTDYETDKILFANRKMVEFNGVANENELVGQYCYLTASDEGERCGDCPHDRLIGSDGRFGPPVEIEKYVEKMGRWVKTIHQAIPWTDGKPAHMVTFYDITEAKVMAEKLANLAFTDQSMGVRNALMLERVMSDPDRGPLSLILYDIRAMQKINEAYGRDIGDALLRAVSEWIRGMGLSGAELYRLDGDGFCVTVPDSDPHTLNAAAYALRARFDEPWRFGGGEGTIALFCDATIGVVPGTMIRQDEPLLNLIERTLKLARENGFFALYDDETDREYQKRLRFELSLKRCVREDMAGFSVSYQPIADPVTGTWCGFEALCRWNSPELGPVSPSQFIPEAERLELIDAVGLWALETAVTQCKDWKLDRRKRFILDVNLSAIQFSDELLVEKIMRVLDSCGFPPEKLCLEITESTQFTFTDLSLVTIQRLRENGILVALDDFGTGYSSFNNLRTLPIDILKIERMFVTNIESDSFQQYLFQAMSELAHAVGMKLVAEGVENREQMEILLKNGADYLQGYLFSKPLTAEQVQQNLHCFVQIEDSFNVIRERKIDIRTLMDAESGYILTPRMYKILNQCMRILFYHEDIDEAVSQVLGIVGRHMDVSRTYVFRREAGDMFVNTCEWHAGGVTSLRKALPRFELQEEWQERLRHDGFILTPDITSLPSLADLKPDTQAIALIPLWEEDRLMGLVGFDDCLYQRDWRPEEVLMLHGLCTILSGVLNKQIMRSEITLNGEILRDILDHLDILIFVSDAKTGEILMANRHLKKLIGRDVTGESCWKVIDNRVEPCPYCLIPKLLEDAGTDHLTWQSHYPVTGKPCLKHNCLIRWNDGRLAHMAYAIETGILPQDE